MGDKENVKLPFFGIGKLWPVLKTHKKLFIRMIVIAIVASSFDASFPLFNKYVLNHYIAEKTLDTLPVFIVLYLVVIAVWAVLNYINVSDSAKIELYMDRDLRNRAFRHMQEVSLSYYNSNNVGYIHARVMSDSGKIGEMVAWKMLDLVWNGSYILIVFAIMLITNFRLALCVMAILPIAIVLMSFFQKKLLHLNHEIREINSKITSNINEGITGAKSIKALAIEDSFDTQFKKDTLKMYRKAVQTTRFNALFTASISMMSAIALALVMWRGGVLSVNSLMEIGTLSVFLSYALGLLDPIQFMVNSVAQMIAIQVNIERYSKLMDTKGEVFDSEEVIEKYGDAFNPKYENWEELKGDIRFDDVTFHYPDGEEMVLEHFNLDIPSGTNVAIVGETGAGKSTLINLVCRFFEPTCGRILIDGKDAKERSLKWLHSNIGYVLQTPYLFSGTVRENLIYGNPEATDEEIMKAIELVSADKILNKLKNGLDTEIGESGDFLSTGEKQLLSIVRAILADPKILILDEATSSIDTITEQIIQDAISKVIKGRTSFVIAHRLSTIVNADIILVVSDGRIIEEGTHKELMLKKGAYYDLYTRQYNKESVDDAFA